MNVHRSRLDARGFTLIEAMISMFFVAFMVGEMAAVSMYAKRSTSFARRIAEANLIAEGVLEKSRNTAYLNLNTQFSAADSPPDPIMFDANRDGVVESSSETCAAPVSPTPCPTTATECKSTVGTYDVVRCITPLQTATTPPVSFAASYGADVDVLVSWTDTKGTQQVRVSSVRSKL